MNGAIKKANIGEAVTSDAQLQSLIRNRKSVVWNWRRVPASIIINQQYRVVTELLAKKKLNIYIKNKV